MKKIGVLTFHSAYNYGSVLQSYALQEFCKKICNEKSVRIEYKIINLRKTNQNEQYAIFRKSPSPKNIIKNIMNIPFYSRLKKKNEKFESFISNKLNITTELKDESELSKLKFDYYITGSDQIWNTTAIDFSYAYFLSFVKSGKKISYAASFGQSFDKMRDKDKIMSLLSDYDYLSVREEKSCIFLKKELNRSDISVNIDPTFLLEKSEWDKLIEDTNMKLPNKDYILFYTLYPNKNVIKLTKEISKKIGLPVIVTKYNNENDYFNQFDKYYSSGPIEFLKLIRGAKYVITSSFHGCVFSIIFNKPFFVIKNSKQDLRLETILKKTGLEDRVLCSKDDIERLVNNKDNISFIKANNVLLDEREKSKEYLLRSLDVIRK